MSKSFRIAIFVVFSLASFLSTSVAAQQKPAATPTPPLDEGPIKTFEVRLPVTITEKKDKLVSGLTKTDFLVLEDGVPQKLTSFTDVNSNPPVYVGVLMDTSPSTAGKLGFSKEAAANFLYTVVQLRKDKAA